MASIIYSEKLEYKLNELVDILFEKRYFGYKESAKEYVQLIRNFIETIPNQTIVYVCSKPTYGKYYARYTNKKSKFKYYITYNLSDERYYIKDIISPKTKAYLDIKGSKK